MLLTVLLALARLQWRRQKSRYAESRARALARGVFPAKAPPGYVQVGEGDDEGKLVLNGRHQDVREAFERARGGSVRGAAKVLGMSRPHARRVLANRAYIGEIHDKQGGVNLQAREPLVDRRTFEAAQSAPPKRGDAYPLVGLVACECGHPMTSGRIGRGLRGYRCASCNTTIVADRLERHVIAQAVAERARRGDDPAVAHPALEAAEARRDRAELELADWAINVDAKEALGEAAWAKGANERRRRMTGPLRRSARPRRSGRARAWPASSPNPSLATSCARTTFGIWPARSSRGSRSPERTARDAGAARR
jgi:hypothetical protein